MKEDKYLKYRKYENWALLLLILGPLLTGFLGVILIIFVNAWVGFIICAILIIYNIKLCNYLDDKATKYMLESYERGDDPYEYVDHLLL